MKKLLTILCLFVLSSYSYSQTPQQIITKSQNVSEQDIIERGGLFYKKFSTTPFTGNTVEFYEDGQLGQLITYKDGLQTGPQEFYYEDGQLGYRGNYKDGNKEGVWETFDEDGNLTKTEEYKDGELIN